MPKGNKRGGEETMRSAKELKLEDSTEQHISNTSAPSLASTSGSAEFTGGSSNEEVVHDNGILKQEEIPNGSIQKNVLDRIPPELWEKIFESLESPKDFLSVINTCDQWHELVSSKCTLLLFPLVLPHLIRYVGEESSDFLPLRQVCKLWRDSIDKSLENLATSPTQFGYSMWPIFGTPFDSAYNDLLWNHYTFTDPQQMEDFQAALKDHGGNPFISRTTSFQFGDRSSREPSLSLLQNFGVHIWHFTFRGEYPEDLDPGDWSREHLPAILRLLPNLKSLSIQDYDGDASDETVELLKTPQGKLGIHFPVLEHLTKLDLNLDVYHCEWEDLLGEALIHRYGIHLDTLECTGRVLESLPIEQFANLLPSLKNLQLRHCTDHTLEALSKLQGFPLQRLQILSDNFTSDGALNFQDFVKAINSFSATLINLQLSADLQYPENCVGSGLIEILNVDFPNIGTVRATIADFIEAGFLEMVRFKFKGLTRLDLISEQQEIDCESVCLEHCHQGLREMSREFFEYLPKLDKIWFWHHAVPFATNVVISR